jgi:diacylglycerol kinase family enzyme
VRVLLVVNPTASSVTPRARAAVEAILRSAGPTEVVETTHRGHAAELARDAVGATFDVVAVLAGDGTLNEAGSGLVGSTVALAPLPGGSTNVFARTLGVAYSPNDAARQLVASLDGGRRRRIGVGEATAPGAGPRPFLFHLGVGFDAAVIRRMEARSSLKRHLAHPAFAVTAVTTWLRHYDRERAIRLTVGDPDGADVAVAGPYAVISNSDPYAYVGRRPLRIAPDASLDRALAVTVLTSLRATLVARAAASAVGHAKLLTTSPEIVQVADASTVTVTADPPFPWQVDGDYLGEVDRLDVTYRPDALTLVVPGPGP